MAVSRWKESVHVQAGRYGSTRYVVQDAEKAAEVMLKQWPRKAPRGPANLKARQKLLDCLMGKCVPEIARLTFIAAAQEAGILMKREGPI